MGKPGTNKTTGNNKAGKKNFQYYNILFLGSTGVGKSTFINAIVNYLKSETLNDAKKNQPTVLINTKFVVTDEKLVEKVIHVAGAPNVSNESETLGDSATQETMVYTFPILGTNIMLRLIDTPGIADTRGINKDEENCDNILRKISSYDELHAICILLQPNHARLTAEFEFSIMQLLSRLDKSATDNIIFIFTNSRSSFYRPGDTWPALQRLLKNIREKPPHVDIPLKSENVFCMDNEAFRFLMAMREVKFTNEEIAQFERSWEVSRKVCLSLLNYIMGDKEKPGLKPHLTKNTVSINEARRVIMQLSQPLADITQLIFDNVYALDQHAIRLNRENQSLSELKKNMFIPVINIKETQFSQPRTVCASLKCMRTYTVQGKTKCHYAQLCHNPCYLSNVPREIIGSPELISCAAMNGTNLCRRCGCDYGKHMHIYYETTLFETEVKDDNVASEITNREVAVKRAEALVRRIEHLKKEHEEEHEFILNSVATFAWFLKRNAITAYNDAYCTYVKYLIDREKSLGDNADEFAIKHLQAALVRYEEYKNILDSAKDSAAGTIKAQAIADLIKKLFTLKHCGAKIKRLFESQVSAHETERENFEYIHHTGLNLTESEPSNRNSNTKKNQNRGNNNNQNQKGKKQYQQQPGNPNKKNWRNPQQNYNNWQGPHQQQQFQPPHWQQPYGNNNYQQGPPNNYGYQGPPNYPYNGPQGPMPFNFAPGYNQQNWPNQMQQQPQQEYYPNPPQQFTPQANQQGNQRQPYKHSGPSKKNTYDNEAGSSKDFNSGAPTGVYNPKSVQKSGNNSFQSLEQQFSSLNVDESDNRNRRPNRNNTNENFHHVRNRNNFKRKQGNHNTQQYQGKNQQRNHDSSDDGEEDNNSQRGKNREQRKNDLLKQTLALAVIEQTHPSETGQNNENASVVDINDSQKAISFFRKLFGS